MYRKLILVFGVFGLLALATSAGLTITAPEADAQTIQRNWTYQECSFTSFNSTAENGFDKSTTEGNIADPCDYSIASIFWFDGGNSYYDYTFNGSDFGTKWINQDLQHWKTRHCHWSDNVDRWGCGNIFN